MWVALVGAAAAAAAVKVVVAATPAELAPTQIASMEGAAALSMQALTRRTGPASTPDMGA
jgi:hypothetical protein